MASMGFMRFRGSMGFMSFMGLMGFIGFSSTGGPPHPLAHSLSPAKEQRALVGFGHKTLWKNVNNNWHGAEAYIGVLFLGQ